MRAATVTIVVAGLAVALALGIQGGFDNRSLVILTLTAAVGAVAIAAARRSSSGSVAPARCAECDGVISPHAPYCKHCGVRRR